VTENRLRVRAERGEVQIGTWITMIRTPGVLTLLQAGAWTSRGSTWSTAPSRINYASDAAVLRAGYASVIADVRRGR
jgi:hypothetical protein